MNQPLRVLFVGGAPDQRVRAFRDTARYLGVRIDLMLALPYERLQREALKTRLENLGPDGTSAPTD